MWIDLVNVMFWVVFGFGFLFIVIPLFVFLVVKTGVYAFFQGKKRFREDDVSTVREEDRHKSNGNKKVMP